MTPAFFLQTKKGHGFSHFQRQTERRLLCLPVLRTDFRTAGLSDFSPSDISHNSLHVARQSRSTGAVGQLYHFHSEDGKKGAPFAYFAGTASEPLLYRSVTLLFLSGKLFYQELSARVSDNRSLHVSCHSYYCKEKKAHSLYNYQVIYIFLLCIKYIFSCILNI